MPVIALPDFVVVTNDADAIDDVGQTVFVVVTRSLDRRRQPPQDQFCECLRGIDDPCPEKLGLPSCWDNDNTGCCCQLQRPGLIVRAAW